MPVRFSLTWPWLNGLYLNFLFETQKNMVAAWEEKFYEVARIKKLSPSETAIYYAMLKSWPLEEREEMLSGSVDLALIMLEMAFGEMRHRLMLRSPPPSPHSFSPTHLLLRLATS